MHSLGQLHHEGMRCGGIPFKYTRLPPTPLGANLSARKKRKELVVLDVGSSIQNTRCPLKRRVVLNERCNTRTGRLGVGEASR